MIVLEKGYDEHVSFFDSFIAQFENRAAQ